MVRKKKTTSNQDKKENNSKVLDGGTERGNYKNPSPSYIRPAAQEPLVVVHKCGREDITKAVMCGVDVNRSTLRIMPLKQDPDKYVFEFTFDAYVHGSVEVYLFEEVVDQDGDISRKKELISPEFDCQQGLKQIYSHNPEHAVDLSLFKKGLTEACYLEIKTNAKAHISDKGGSDIREITVSTSTRAVFEKESAESNCVIKVAHQRLWLDGKKFANHGNGNSIKECMFCTLNTNSDKGKRVGKLLVSNVEIGKGHVGSVYKGEYEGREAAVKLVPKELREVAEEESEILKKCDRHPNVLRYYGMEEDADYIYIGVERCECTLADLILSHADPNCKLNPAVDTFKHLELWGPCRRPSWLLLKLLREVVAAVNHLQKLGITRYELHPKKILIQKDDDSISVRVSSLGSSKYRHSSVKTSAGCGWQAPELLEKGNEQTCEADSFSLGCLFFWCVNRGIHPFGEECDRDANILAGKMDLTLLRILPEANDLIPRLLNPIPELRPTGAKVYSHPFFWDPQIRLQFILAAYDRAKAEGQDSEFVKSLEARAEGIASNWYRYLDSKLRSEMEDSGDNYRANSIYELLRFIRNKFHHPLMISEESLAAACTELDKYFRLLIPKLVMCVYNALYCQ